MFDRIQRMTGDIVSRLAAEEQAIADDGFSDRVMSAIDRAEAVRRWTLAIAAFVGGGASAISLDNLVASFGGAMTRTAEQAASAGLNLELGGLSWSTSIEPAWLAAGAVAAVLAGVAWFVRSLGDA
jgi:hypothetical protein